MHLTIIVNRCNFNGLFNGKLSCALNLIFIKSLPYSPFLPSFIVYISVHFFNTSSFSSAESKTKYRVISGPYFPVFGLNLSVFSPNTGKYEPEITPYLDTFHAVNTIAFNMSIYFTNYQIQRIYTVNIFTITNFFNCDASNMVNINIFVRFFVHF